MGKKNKKRGKEFKLGDTTPEGFNNPFAALLKGKEAAEPGPAPEEPGDPAPTEADPIAAGLGRSRKVVLQRERKRRKGHTAIVVSGVDLDPEQLDALARELRKGLGTSASVEGAEIVVQGDIAERVESWLKERGASKVIRGN